MRLRISSALAVLLLASAGPARSESQILDYSAALEMRSYPFGAGAFGEAGYSLPLWGKKEPGEFRYGFVRAWGRLSSSAVVNRGDAQIDLHPISFLTLGAGYGQSLRDTDVERVDCALVACRQGLGGPRLTAALLLGTGPFAGGTSWTRASLNPSVTDRDFADESSNLVGARGGDTRVSWDAFLAMNLAPTWRAALYASADRMNGSGQTNSLKALMVRNQLGAWAWSLGTGAYSSSVHPSGLTVFGQLKWVGARSLELD